GVGFARIAELVLGVGRLLAMILAPLVMLVALRFMTRRQTGGIAYDRDPQLVLAGALPAAKPQALPRARAEDLTAQKLQNELGVLAKSDPGTVAQVVRGWIAEDRGGQ